MKSTLELLVIAGGGACGALFRYFIASFFGWAFKGPFPWGTFIANLAGCLLIGLMLGGEHDQKNEWLRLGFGIGFLGSLTTFSTFGAETVKHAIDGNWSMAATNIAANLVICVSAVAIGIALGKKIWV